MGNYICFDIGISASLGVGAVSLSTLVIPVLVSRMLMYIHKTTGMIPLIKLIVKSYTLLSFFLINLGYLLRALV